MTLPGSSLISVCVPSFRRPEGLNRLCDAVLRQRVPLGVNYELIIVDNDCERSAEPVACEYASKAGIHIQYSCEPIQGIARVRNRLIDEAHGRWIAFLDDDEWPDAGWLEALWRTWHTHRADIVFGPVLPAYPAHVPRWVKRTRVFERPHFADGELVSPKNGGAGNMFCERGIFARTRVRFSEVFDAGGEDTDANHRLACIGARFVWSKQAVVFEEVPDSRMQVAFWLNRAFRGGFRHTRVYGMENHRAVVRTASVSVVKAVALSALLVPSCVAGRSGFVKTAVPWAASLGALTACVDRVSKRSWRHVGSDDSPSLLVIGPTPPPHHGVSMAVQALLDSNLHEGGFRVRHVDLADRRGIQHVDRPDFHDVLLFVGQWFRMLTMLRRERAHLIYIPLSQTTIGFLRDSLLMWPAYLLGARVVFHLHGGQFRAWYDARSWLLKTYIRLVLRSASRVVVLGESLRSIFERLVAPKRIDVVPNGIVDVRRRLGRNNGCLRILHLGTLSRAKGTLVLLDAATKILATRREAEFVFAGPWLREQDRRDAETIAVQSALVGHIVFTGQVDALRKEELLASSDVFVFAGVQQEGQPLVVLEAMAAGLPIVFTDRGCLRETVVNGVTGCEVRVNDPNDLSRTLLWLFDHPEERQRMGQAARRRYETLYTLDRHVERMTDVFARTLQEAG